MQTKGIWKEGQCRLQRDNLDLCLQFHLRWGEAVRRIRLHLSTSFTFFISSFILDYRILSGLFLTVHFNDALFLFSISNSVLKTAAADRAGQHISASSTAHLSFWYLFSTLGFFPVPVFVVIYSLDKKVLVWVGFQSGFIKILLWGDERQVNQVNQPSSLSNVFQRERKKMEREREQYIGLSSVLT